MEFPQMVNQNQNAYCIAYSIYEAGLKSLSFNLGCEDSGRLKQNIIGQVGDPQGRFVIVIEADPAR